MIEVKNREGLDKHFYLTKIDTGKVNPPLLKLRKGTVKNK